ncbi:MAG: MerR family transcriptional regulator [Clostridia bacterium]
MIKRMLPVHIRKLLGISRSAMRYYMRKGLLTAKKDEDNGYSYFSGGDLLELIDVAYYRNCLNAETEDIKKLTYAESLEEQEANYSEQIDAFEEKIKRQEFYLTMLRDFDKQIKRAIKWQNQIGKVHIDAPFYLYYPELNSHVDIHAEHFQVSYWISEFGIEEGQVVFRRSSMMVGAEFVDILDTEFPGIRYQKIFAGDFLYTSFCSDKDMSDPSLLEDCVAYAKEHHYALSEPILIRYLLTLRRNGKRCHCFEAYLPLSSER